MGTIRVMARRDQYAIARNSLTHYQSIMVSMHVTLSVTCQMLEVW